MRKLFALALVAFALVGCGDDDTSDDTAEPSSTITVFAASSLTDAFTDIGADFESANPGTTVEFNFGSSSDLSDSIVTGDALGTADVFASADRGNAEKVAAAGASSSSPVLFAQNRAEIAVPVDNPGGVEGLDDFAEDDLLIGLCAEEVPCGEYARQVLDNAGVEPSVDTYEAKVTDVVDKVISGELDAGIVYISDVVAHEGEMEGIVIPADVNVVADYAVVTVAESDHADLAAAFVAYLHTPDAQAALEDAGFIGA